MKNKNILIVLVILLICTGGMFAQERQGYFKPTFSGGPLFFMDAGNTFTVFSLDLDYVGSSGLTIGFSDYIYLQEGNTINTFPVSVGYTYDFGRGAIGSKIMVMSFFPGNILGVNLNGTLWFSNNIGLSVLLDLQMFSASGSDPQLGFAARAGLSLKI